MKNEKMNTFEKEIDSFVVAEVREAIVKMISDKSTGVPNRDLFTEQEITDFSSLVAEFVTPTIKTIVKTHCEDPTEDQRRGFFKALRPLLRNKLETVVKYAWLSLISDQRSPSSGEQKPIREFERKLKKLMAS